MVNENDNRINGLGLLPASQAPLESFGDSTGLLPEECLRRIVAMEWINGGLPDHLRQACRGDYALMHHKG